MTDYIDAILRETASRAVTREAPLSYREARERWNDALEKKNAFQHKFFRKQDAAKQDSNRQFNNRGGGARGRGGTANSGSNRAGASLKGREPNSKETRSATTSTTLPVASGSRKAPVATMGTAVNMPMSATMRKRQVIIV